MKIELLIKQLETLAKEVPGREVFILDPEGEVSNIDTCELFLAINDDTKEVTLVDEETALAFS